MVTILKRLEHGNLEREFLTRWRQLGGPELKREYKFHPRRRWKFDFVDLASRVAIEVEGGTWAGGRHTTGRGYSADCQKYNQATLLGWVVFRFTSDMLRDDPAGHLGPVIELIKERADL